jgi:hypothetical protein
MTLHVLVFTAFEQLLNRAIFISHQARSLQVKRQQHQLYHPCLPPKVNTTTALPAHLRRKQELPYKKLPKYRQKMTASLIFFYFSLFYNEKNWGYLVPFRYASPCLLDRIKTT